MNWGAFFAQCSQLLLDAAVWVMLARTVGRALRGVGRG